MEQVAGDLRPVRHRARGARLAQLRVAQALALASAFVPLRPQLLQLKPMVSSARRRTLLRMSESRSDNGTRDDEFDLEPRTAKDDAPKALELKLQQD